MIITTYKIDMQDKLIKVVVFRSIGSVFRLFGKELLRVKKVSIKKHCSGCALETFKTCEQFKYVTGHCHSTAREDKKNVIFVPCGIFYKILNAVKSLIWRE